MALTAPMTTTWTLRVARPTNRLDAIAEMYRVGLDFEVLEQFADHQGFDGIILGHGGHPYHIEFTAKRGHGLPDAPSQDNLLVFYIPARHEWEASCARMIAAGFRHVPAFNPYWDVSGRTFEDPDGYRVVLQNEAWA
jgi:hypothetical protein